MTTGVGGAATTAVPRLEHWPTASVAVVVVVFGLVGGLARKLLHAAVIAVTLTAMVVVGDAVAGGHIQHTLNLGALLHKGGA